MSETRDEDFLPLQNFGGTAGARNEERRQPQENRKDHKPGFKPGLHIHGDLSVNRPGHLKRWDSEAKIGDGHGVEEVEDRI